MINLSHDLKWVNKPQTSEVLLVSFVIVSVAVSPAGRAALVAEEIVSFEVPSL